MASSKIVTAIKEYLFITVGILLYTVGWSIFIIPNQLVGGGVTGISAIIQYCTGFPISYSYFLINTILLIIALKVLGKGFGAKTVYAVLIASISYKIWDAVLPAEFIQTLAIDNGKMMCVAIGGLVSGLGCSLAISHGGSSGGTDIIALMINKFYNISTGTVIIALDVIIIACTLLVPSDATWGSRIADVMYGYICSGIFSLSLDFFLTGHRQSVQIFIFSEQFAEIADKISTQGNRGVSVIDAQGWYTKQTKKMLLVVCRKTEKNAVLSMVKAIDPKAFISVGSVNGVYGEGFEAIKK